MKRGDVVLCASAGDHGKPRPAVVVQSDLFNETHHSVTLCPLTSDLKNAPFFRLNVVPTPDNGLKKPSQIMIDQVVSLPVKRIREVVGRLNDWQVAQVDAALRFWLSLD